ncbi:hypothetical protein IFM89_031975 [Coptis chinensis]|uniref:Uncharacterized protein n=1 Tax=Coptis chinensis TaxID=261450 RepID=A0A835LL25_9MAGN|nr:hypothetical protein IFM89_031975 [Coptis chinensis]
MSIACWNTRGLNDINKAKEVHKAISENNLCIVALLETKVRQDNFSFFSQIACPSWEYLNNYDSHFSGRICLAWDPKRARILKLFESEQILHVKAHGCFYTWTNNGDYVRKWSKIDRCLVNSCWNSQFHNSSVTFLTQGVSDHSLFVVSWHDNYQYHPPFRFCNFWCLHPDFKDTLLEAWESSFIGNPLFILTQKLKVLKPQLKNWARSQCSNIKSRVLEARKFLFEVQTKMHLSPLDVSLYYQEKQARLLYTSLVSMEEVDLKQRSHCNYMQYGDRCNAFFHKSIQEKKGRNSIWSVEDNSGIKSTTADVADSFIKYYSEILGVDYHINADMDFFNNIVVKMLFNERNTRIFSEKYRPLTGHGENTRRYEAIHTKGCKGYTDSTSVRVLLQNLGIDANYHAKEPIYRQWRKRSEPC